MSIVYSDSVYKECDQINETELQEKTAIDILRWAYGMYDDNIVYACSLGAEGMVLLDLISKVQPGANVIFLDTEFHFQETYQLLEKVQKRFSQLSIHVVKPRISQDEQSKQYGDELWKKDPDTCCSLRKMMPLEKELAHYDAWISGLRREQSPSRKNTQFINPDARFKSIKVCPLIHWTWDDVWAYITTHDLPYNTLHDQNYPSIGCFHCTTAVTDGEDGRNGRWKGMGKTECGLHR
ncbi:phosphoadenylyl-sulfate reductase [Alteribacillus iranensis]|uniref:Adenosine 5'-phosphosulfate reductase n=1 Tax=Alteribacillus iranensis TaxID=930128 RepID=A0A1I2A0M4_9BACI|nr:phosphoadenylyl-sulfate reductase [Alteribacillus iranensis]SFE36290.1 phosphoadenylylsulfate reductase (thioredoxin) [Alteribacillus iranensis]